MSIACSGVLGHEEHRVAERLDHPAVVGGDDVAAAGLEDLDELAEPVWSSSLDSAEKLHQVGEPDGDRRRRAAGPRPSGPASSRRRARRRGAGARRARAARSSAVGDLVGDPPERPARRGCPESGRRLAGLDLLGPRGQGRHLPVRHPGDVLPDGPDQPDRRGQVDVGVHDRVDDRPRRVQVGVAVAGPRPRVGEARAPARSAGRPRLGQPGRPASSAVGVAAPRRRRVASGAVIAAGGPGSVELVQLLGDQRCTCSTRGMSWSGTRPCSLASETTRVPQPKSRSTTPISKSTPLIRLSGIVRPSLAMKPGALDEAPVGEGVGRGQPAHERPAPPTSTTTARPRRRRSRRAAVADASLRSGVVDEEAAARGPRRSAADGRHRAAP